MARGDQSARLYRGISPSERRAQRRERLLNAGLEQFGTHGYADSSIRSVCAEAAAGLRAAWTILAENPRRARIIFIEAVGVSERLERLRRENRHAFAHLLVQNSRIVTGDDISLRLDPVLTARSLP